MLSRIWRFV